MNGLMPQIKEAFYTQHRKNFSKDHVFDKRVTRFYELVYFLDESDCNMLLDQKMYHIQGNTVVFRRPGQWNQSFMPYESILLRFQWDWGSEEKAFVEALSTLNTHLEETNYRQLFEEIYQESLLNRPYGEHYMSAKLMEILHGLYYERRPGTYHRQSAISHPVLMDLLHYIDDHLREDLNIEAIGRKVGVSQRYVYKLFKEHLGMTPIKYINSCRLNYAKKLLKYSNIPVHEIAGMSGFANETYFITLFGREEGMTPLRYRRHDKGVSS